jgi:hypothetical protein
MPLPVREDASFYPLGRLPLRISVVRIIGSLLIPYSVDNRKPRSTWIKSTENTV